MTPEERRQFILSVSGVTLTDEAKEAERRMQDYEKGIRHYVYASKTYKSINHVPDGYISTKDASQLLCCTMAATRMFCEKHHIKTYLVWLPGKVPSFYMPEKEIRKYADQRAPLVTEVPKGWLRADDAVAILGIARATLYRWVRRGQIEEKQVRLKTDLGTRKITLYKPEEVERMSIRSEAQMLRLMLLATISHLQTADPEAVIPACKKNLQDALYILETEGQSIFRTLNTDSPRWASVVKSTMYSLTTRLTNVGRKSGTEEKQNDENS